MQRMSWLLLLAGCSATTAPKTTAYVRVAHLSDDAPAVDFCVAPHGTTSWTGPILASNGHLTGLVYGKVTKYFPLAAAQYDVRLVPPGMTDCKTSLGGLPDFTDLPELPDGTYATIAAEGLVAFGSPTPFALHPYIDDADVEAGKLKLRFIHASPGTPPVDVGLGGGALFTAVFTDIAYGNAAASNSGYVETDAITDAEISARAHGSASDALSIKPASLPAGQIATAFAIGELTSQDAPLRVLLCTDSAPPNGLLSACDVVGGTPERAHVRIAHLSPDTPAVDVCLAPTGTGAFAGPVLKSLGAGSGLAYPQVTSYVDLPVGSYDARIVHATASGCDLGAVPDTDAIAVASDLTATIAAIGVLDPTGPAANDPALHLAVLPDDTSVAAGQSKLRFVHASPGTPAVDVGLGSGASFEKVFADVSFGQVGGGNGIDGDGFVQTSPLTSAVAARLANQSADALVVPSVTLAAGGIATAFAIGGKTGASDNPLAVLWCSDNAPGNGLLAACAVAP